MTGILLGAAVLWASWPLRMTATQFWRQPSTVLLPAVFAASLVYYLVPAWGLPAFGVCISSAAALSLLERRRVLAEVGRQSISRKDRRSVGLLAALVIWLTARDVAGSGVEPEVVLGLFASLLVLFGLTQSIRHAAFTARLTTWCSASFLGVALLLGGLTNSEWTDCRPEFDKCSVAGRLYIGVFNSENALAFLAALVVALGLGQRWRRRPVLVLAVIVTIVLTGSRTALVGGAVALLALPIIATTAVRINSQGFRTFRVNRAVALLGPAFAGSVGLLLGSYVEPGSLSRRGDVWTEIRQFADVTSLTGIGRGRYVELLDAGYFRGHYPHSQYMLLVAFGGLIAVAIFVAALCSLWASVRCHARAPLAFACAPIVFALAYGWTELFWNPVGVDPNIWTVAALLSVAGSRSHDPGPDRTNIVLGAEGRA